MCGLASAIHRASASVTANARRRSATSSATRAAAATAATRRGAETKCATHASRAAERRSAALERSFLSFSGVFVFVATLRAATRDSRSRRAFERSSRLLGVAASIFRRAVTLLPARSRQACVAATSARLLRKLSAKLPTCAARSRSRTATRHCPKARARRRAAVRRRRERQLVPAVRARRDVGAPREPGARGGARAGERHDDGIILEEQTLASETRIEFETRRGIRNASVVRVGFPFVFARAPRGVAQRGERRARRRGGIPAPHPGAVARGARAPAPRPPRTPPAPPS